jgi:hypothetical protein
MIPTPCRANDHLLGKGGGSASVLQVQGLLEQWPDQLGCLLHCWPPQVKAVRMMCAVSLGHKEIAMNTAWQQLFAETSTTTQQAC